MWRRQPPHSREPNSKHFAFIDVTKAAEFLGFRDGTCAVFQHSREASSATFDVFFLELAVNAWLLGLRHN
jgi:hypothetical protein